MKTYYIEYDVYEDNYRYCGYIEAQSKADAIETIKKEDGDVKRIVRCEIAY